MPILATSGCRSPSATAFEGHSHLDLTIPFLLIDKPSPNWLPALLQSEL